jgi:hypothetical protein
MIVEGLYYHRMKENRIIGYKERNINIPRAKFKPAQSN